MKIMFLILALSLIINASSKNIEVGIVLDEIEDFANVHVLLKVIKKSFNKKNKNLKLNFSLFKNKNNILNAFKKNDLQILVSHPFFYYEHKKIMDSLHNAKWLTTVNKQKTEQYYLISKEKSLDKIKNFALNTLYSIKDMKNSRIWFEYFHKKHLSKANNKEALTHHLMNKENKIMHKVFFNKKSLGIITKVSYDLLIELNPQLKKHIHILAKSKKIFISYIAFSHKSVSAATQNSLKSISSIFQDVFGSSRMSRDIGYTLYKLKNDSILKDFENFFKEYTKTQGAKDPQFSTKLSSKPN